ncbi:MAG: serine hydrolase domain-containing protein [Pseudomonadales bacterium]
MSLLHGTVHPDFADVAQALRPLIKPREGAGAAVCVYHRGECVVDIWGGARSLQGEPWMADTTAPSFSTTKGVLSTLLHIQVDRGLLRYDDPIALHWSAFGAAGKEHVTVRQALCHQAGLYRIRDLISDPHEMLDWPHMLELLAAAPPVHEPGAAQGYHAITYGWLIGGLLEAVTGKPLRQILLDDLVMPLQLDGAFIGMPSEALPRRAELIRGVSRPRRTAPRWQGRIRAISARVARSAGLNLDEFDAALNPFSRDFDWNAEATVQALIPAANGQFTARSLARIYAMLAGRGELEGTRTLSAPTVQALSKVQSRARDRVLLLPMHWRLGYHRAFVWGSQSPTAFGHYGYGGSGAFCDPLRSLSVAFTLNSGAGTPMGNTSMPRIARAALRSADARRA